MENKKVSYELSDTSNFAGKIFLKKSFAYYNIVTIKDVKYTVMTEFSESDLSHYYTDSYNHHYSARQPNTYRNTQTLKTRDLITKHKLLVKEQTHCVLEHKTNKVKMNKQTGKTEFKCLLKLCLCQEHADLTIYTSAEEPRWFINHRRGLLNL